MRPHPDYQGAQQATDHRTATSLARPKRETGSLDSQRLGTANVRI